MDDKLRRLEKAWLAAPHDARTARAYWCARRRAGLDVVEDVPGSEGGFQVVLADPPWRYKNWSDKAHGAAKAHYEGLTFDELRVVPVGAWAGDDAVLLLWGTWPKADQAMDLCRAWGFDFVTGFPWVKTTPSTGGIRRGVGFWSMGCSEFVFIGRRGSPKALRLKPNVLGLLSGDERSFWCPRPRGGDHSNKPYVLHEYAEDKLSGPYLELFAREAREGWTCWGHELGQHICGDGVLPIEEAVRRGLIPADAVGVPNMPSAPLDPALEGF